MAGHLPNTNESLNDKVYEVDAQHGLEGAILDGLRTELLGGNGFCRLRNVVQPRDCQDLRKKALMQAKALSFDDWPGVRSKRVRDPLEWGGASAAQVFNAIAEKASPLLEEILGPRAWVTSIQALALFPTDYATLSKEAEKRLVAGGLHSDYPYGEFKEGMDRGSATNWQFPTEFHQPRTLQLILVLDEFTAERGATRLLPGSAFVHVDTPPREPGAEEADRRGGRGARIPSPTCDEDSCRFSEGCVAVEGSIGDAIIYLGHTWHTISVNRGQSPRVALLLQVSPFYFAPLEAIAWVIPLQVERRLSRRSCELLSLPGTTMEGAGGEGESSKHVPHRSDPRPLGSCAAFAMDTLARLQLGTKVAVMLSPVVVAVAAASLVSQVPNHRLRMGAVATTAMAAHGMGYLLGIVAVIRRFDF